MVLETYAGFPETVSHISIFRLLLPSLPVCLQFSISRLFSSHSVILSHFSLTQHFQPIYLSTLQCLKLKATTPDEPLALVRGKKKKCFIFQSHVCAQKGQANALIIHFLNQAISVFGPGLHHRSLFCSLVAISRPCFCAVVQRFCPLMDIFCEASAG